MPSVRLTKNSLLSRSSRSMPASKPQPTCHVHALYQEDFHLLHLQLLFVIVLCQ